MRGIPGMQVFARRTRRISAMLPAIVASDAPSYMRFARPSPRTA